jgi:hypothetical protein
MNKKGTSIILMTFEVVIVILVVLMTSGVARSLGSKDSVVRSLHVEEMRLMVNALAGVPGDAVVHYPQEVGNYTFVLGQDRIAIFRKGESEGKRFERKFFLPEGYSAVGIEEGVRDICIEKKGKKIELRKCKEHEIG